MKIISFIGEFGADANKVAQMAHAEAGFISAYTLGWVGALIVLVPWAIPKEFYLDVKYENASYRGGLIDWSFYALGVAVGLIARALR
jgi:hypothetical protein